MTRSGAILLLLLAGACVPGNGPDMAPFQDCLGCHSAAGTAKAWSAAGTWRKGVHVAITDATGKTVTLRGNDVGNFYTREHLVFPLTVSVDGKVMSDSGTGAAIPVTYGGCNACHRAETITVGPDMAPGSDCLVCHSAGGMASDHPFTAAGTFAPDLPVQVGGQTTTTRPVSGNFYLTGPITFPAAAIVGGSSMEGGASYGGCGRCHGAGGSGEGGN